MVSDNREVILKTFGLGSCVAVLIYDIKIRIAGLLHVALPDSSVDTKRAGERPGYYADTGLPLFIEAMKRLGAVKSNIRIKLAGGANTLSTIDSFDIGKRNVIAVKKYLWKYALGPLKEDVGGERCRTVSIAVATGEVVVSSGSERWEL